MIYPCLSLWQPWASLVVGGCKRIETRSWSTRYRGPLAIHATRFTGPPCAGYLEIEPYRSALAGMAITSVADLPRGYVLGIVDLVDVYPFRALSDCPSEPEATFGDYTPGRFGWRLKNPRRLRQPIPARGGQRLWKWKPPQVLDFVT